MSRRPTIRDLEQKLKATLLEVEAFKEMCVFLMSERDDYELVIFIFIYDHETEMRSLIFMNTKLKSKLVEMDIKRNDLSDQLDRLQVESRNLNSNSDVKLNYDLPSGRLDCTRATQTKQMSTQSAPPWCAATGSGVEGLAAQPPLRGKNVPTSVVRGLRTVM
ncbi:hypothetical protein EVAR_83961_1 [Eumeta japonica]|uniref:Uncharacterized protein n=1 Tax=Eumeta variegata TaxID=151549 RepID=A0A4C1VNN1_EUMVA|nr:hypothetical protein EVAR_83961_1 [Eumeta japonica]